MTAFVAFGGLRHYPVGKAQLHSKNDKLVVSALERPTDGIAIETGHATDVAVQFAPLELKAGTVLAITFQATDRVQRLKNIGQWIILPEADRPTACLVMSNSPQEGSIALTGRRQHSDLFHRHIRPQQGSKWISLASFDLAQGSTWLSGIRCRMETLRDSSGRITKLTTAHTISSSAMIAPVKQSPMAGESYRVDALHIVSTMQYPGGLPYEWESRMAQVVITGQSIDAIILTHSRVQ